MTSEKFNYISNFKEIPDGKDAWNATLYDP